MIYLKRSPTQSLKLRLPEHLHPFINIYKTMESCQFDKWTVYDDTVDYDKLTDFTL